LALALELEIEALGDRVVLAKGQDAVALGLAGFRFLLRSWNVTADLLA